MVRTTDLVHCTDGKTGAVVCFEEITGLVLVNVVVRFKVITGLVLVNVVVWRCTLPATRSSGVRYGAIRAITNKMAIVARTNAAT